METEMLKTTLNKIGGLLAIGFGEAGSKIVAKNMQKGDEVNPMLPGQKIMCIFGFCDIRNFTDATEVLREEVMLFVNEIGEIVHGTVDKYSGAANKNVGDAFLLVWKFEKEDTITDTKTGVLSVKECGRVSQLADMSVVSFVQLIAALTKNRKMIKYNNHTGLNERMPGFRVKLGIGLAMGYAIEGPIGSYYKIDASYLSPHVNMSMRLEAATKHYGVPLLLTQTLSSTCTLRTVGYCRVVDWVRMGVAGKEETMMLFTIDLDLTRLAYEKETEPLTIRQIKFMKIQ